MFEVENEITQRVMKTTDDVKDDELDSSFDFEMS